MPVPTFCDSGTWNLRDVDTDLIVGKVHVEGPANDAAGGRGYVMHWAVIKSSTGESGFGVYAKPTQQNAKRWKWEGTGESATQFFTWMNESNRKPNLRFVTQFVREQDAVP